MGTPNKVPLILGNSHVTTSKQSLKSRRYLEGHGDLKARLIMGIIGVTIWVIGVMNLLNWGYHMGYRGY